MRERDREIVAGMRNVIAALENAEAVSATTRGTTAAMTEHVAGGAVGLGAGEVSRRLLSADDERALVEGEVAELRASSAELAAAGQRERSAELVRVAEIVAGVLDDLA